LAEGLTAELVVGSLPQNIHDSELCKGFPMEKMAQIHLILKKKNVSRLPDFYDKFQ
jgi:hypothetical protein